MLKTFAVADFCAASSILLEKGLLDDYDVDAILVENTQTVAFARTTTDSAMNGDWDGK